MELSDLPSPPGLPFLEQLPALAGRHINVALERWADELGPKFVVRAPGQEVLVIADAEQPVALATTARSPNSWDTSLR